MREFKKNSKKCSCCLVALYWPAQKEFLDTHCWWRCCGKTSRSGEQPVAVGTSESRHIWELALLCLTSCQWLTDKQIILFFISVISFIILENRSLHSCGVSSFLKLCRRKILTRLTFNSTIYLVHEEQYFVPLLFIMLTIY